jgi:hypothetical protein
VYDYKVINPTTVLLYLGSKAPDSTLILVLKNLNPRASLKPFLGGLDFYGVVTRYNNQPAIVIPNLGYKTAL